jgi:CRP/FNR family transcriptional regulator, nitrogen fixation regulation protein
LESTVPPRTVEGTVDTFSSASLRQSVKGTLRLDQPLERLAVVSTYETGQPIHRYKDPAEHWFRIVAGAGRKIALSADGHRQVVDFLLPGDFFGLCVSSAHNSCVEAVVTGTSVARYARCSAERLADFDPQIARLVRQIAFASIARLQRRTIILGHSSALEKVSGFLLEMADRNRAESVTAVYLPMSRYDIADYLAMAVETLCRTLTSLRTRRVIDFRNARHVRICDAELLGMASIRSTAGVGARVKSERTRPLVR